MQEYKVLIKNKETDNLNTAFGIRTIKMDAQKGLSVNDKNLELKGGCIHHDNGPLGSASIDRGFLMSLRAGHGVVTSRRICKYMFTHVVIWSNLN